MAKEIQLHREVVRAIDRVSREIRQQNAASSSLASDLRQLGHLVFGSMVLAQVFNLSVDKEIALTGIGTLVVLYVFAQIVSRGGDNT